MVSKRGGKQSSSISSQLTRSTESTLILQSYPGSPDEVQSPVVHLNSPDANQSIGVSKNVRRSSRSIGLDKMRGSNKFQIEICKFTGNPLGLHSDKFSSEVGIVTRLFAAPDALQWQHVSAENKATLFKFLQEKFTFSKDTYDVVGILAMMKDRYKSYQYTLHQWFRKHPTMELALSDVPDKISKLAWTKMCEAWSDHFYMEKCKKAKTNRSKLYVPHTSGSKSFRKVQYEQRNPATGEDPTLVQLYEATHYNRKKKAWVNDETEYIHAKLKARNDEAISDGIVPLTAEELSIDVLGYKPGSIRPLGRGAKPSTSASGKQSRVQLERELEYTKKDLEEKRSANRLLADRVESLESDSMKVNSKLDMLMEQMARGQPSYNPFE